MILHKQNDPRNPIERLSRKELEHLARHENRDDIVDGMPADLMKRKFMDYPPAVMPRPMRPNLGSQQRLEVPPYEQWVRVAFGQTSQQAQEQEQVPETDATSDLEKQWLAQQAAQTDFSTLPFWQLKKECAARGIKFSRTHKKAELVAMLNGKELT